MKPATQQAIDHASQIILESIQNVNGGPWVADENASSGTKIKAVDKRTQALRDTLKALYATMNSRIAESRRERNTHIPINKLPLELLVKIFRIHMEDVGIHFHYARLYKLATVSHQWNAFIKNTPDFWSCISTTYWPGFVQKALIKSKNAPLTVQFHLSHLHFPVREATDYVALCRNIHRWETASIDLRDPDALKYLTSPAPTLTDFHLSFEPRHAGQVNLFAGSADRLEHLRLERVSVTWASRIFSGLRSLEIAQPAISPSLSQVHKMLQNCPNLKRLLIAFQSDYFYAAPEEHPPVIMTHLTQLAISNLAPHYCQQLLSLLRIPNCASYQILCDLSNNSWHDHVSPDHPSPTAFLRDALTPSLVPLHAIIDKVHEIVFTLTTTSFTCHDGLADLKPRFRVELLDVPPAESFGWIVNAFKTALSSKSVTVRLLNRVNLYHTALLPTLTSLGMSLKEISVSGRPEGLNRLFEHLGTPIRSDRTVSWPNQNLQTLSIEAPIEEGQLKAMVYNRYGRAVNWHVGERVALPTPFKALAVPVGERDPLWVWLQGIVGKMVLRQTTMLGRLQQPITLEEFAAGFDDEDEEESDFDME